MAAADLIVRGRIATLAGADGFGWTDAFAVLDGRIVAHGSRSEVEPFHGPGTRLLDLADDEVAMPGIPDAHLHLRGSALAATELDLEAVESLDAALSLVAHRHLELTARGHRTGWILCRGCSTDP